MSRYPDGFLWGVATAGHQIEGGDRLSDTTFLEHVSPTIFREPAGDACDSYRRWPVDLDLAAGMGLTAFRFSVEWSRVQPGEEEFDTAALDHYAAVVDGCLERGLAPIVTFNHFSAPHWFAARGGWLDGDSAERFARYADRVMAAFGDRIAAAVTLNEPNLPRLLSEFLPPPAYELTRATLRAAAEAAGVPRYRTANVVQPEDLGALEDGLERAHVSGRQAIRARRGEMPVGISIAITDDVAEPGGEALRDRKRAVTYGRWLGLARDDAFIGVQNYERFRYGPEGLLPPPEGAVLNAMGSAVEPGSLAGAVRYAHETAGVPVLVTEHGVSTSDDRIRTGLLAPSLDGLRAAMDDGVRVLGYCHWSLMDNFEWIDGYEGQLGLHALDRSTFERIPKPSAAEYARLVALARAGGGPGGVEADLPG